MKKFISKDDITRCISITSLAKEFGIKTEDAASGNFDKRCSCPSLEHKGGNERTGSLYIDTMNNNFFCFGCLLPNQEVLTPDRGLVSIKDLKVKDRVFDKFGEVSAVTSVIEKNVDEDLIFFRLGNMHNHSLSFTEKHTMLVCRNVEDKLNYIRENSKTNKIKFNSQAKNRSPSKYSNVLSDEEIEAKDVKIGDYFYFPTIKSDLKIRFMKNKYIRRYHKGPKNKRIEEVPINKDTMWLFGLYCAEGSSYRGGIRLSMHIDEEHILNRASKIIKDNFYRESTIHIRKDKTLSELTCSSTDLEMFFKNTFGKLCHEKKAPPFFIRLEKELQEEFWNGVMDGDATKDKSVLGITSYNLICIMQQISVNLEKVFSFSIKPKLLQKKQVYALRFYKKNSINAFYEYVNGHKSLLQRVVQIDKEKLDSKVFDISVKGSNTFLCKDYVVHNCNTGSNVVDFYMLCTNQNFTDAIKDLRARIDPSNATGAPRLPVQSNLGELLKISSLLRDTMISNPNDLKWINDLMKNIDKYIFDIHQDDVKKAKALHKMAYDKIQERYK